MLWCTSFFVNKNTINQHFKGFKVKLVFLFEWVWGAEQDTQNRAGGCDKHVWADWQLKEERFVINNSQSGSGIALSKYLLLSVSRRAGISSSLWGVSKSSVLLLFVGKGKTQEKRSVMKGKLLFLLSHFVVSLHQTRKCLFINLLSQSVFMTEAERSKGEMLGRCKSQV